MSVIQLINSILSLLIHYRLATMLYWRIAGINYLQFSRIAAQAMRRGLKPEVQQAALKLEEGLMKKTKWENGKPIKE